MVQQWLLRLGRWLVARFEPLPLPEPIVDVSEIRQAVYAAAADVGLHKESLAYHTDLVRTGKLYEVLYEAAARLGRDHELRTIGDVIEWLAEAPKG